MTNKIILGLNADGEEVHIEVVRTSAREASVQDLEDLTQNRKPGFFQHNWFKG